MIPGAAWTTRTRNTTSTAFKIPLKRFAVEVVAAMARKSGWPKTKRRPSVMSWRRRVATLRDVVAPARACG